MFVRLSSPLYTHACTRLPLLPTPPLHSYATERRKKEGWKKEKKERKEGYRGKEGGRSFVRIVAFVRSVSCPVLYCAVTLGSTATRSIVIALPFSHHHQQAVAEIATASERERETRPPACVWLVNNKQRYSRRFSRVCRFSVLHRCRRRHSHRSQSRVSPIVPHRRSFRSHDRHHRRNY